MNTEPINSSPFVSTERSGLISLAISSVLQLVGTVRIRVHRMAQIQSTLAIEQTVKARTHVNAKIASTLRVIGSIFSGSRRKVRAKAKSTLRLDGTVDPRVRARAKIASTPRLVGTVYPRVKHIVRIHPIVSVLRLVGTVRGHDLATGPASESRTVRVQAQERIAIVPGDERLSEAV